MFRRLVPLSCSQSGAGIPRSAAGRCPICRTEFGTPLHATALPREAGQPVVVGDRPGHARLPNTTRRS